jgi:hypothetical protein
MTHSGKHPKARVEKEKPTWERFIGVLSLALAFLIPLIQVNIVDVNWWQSLVAYIVLLAICLWSFLWHAVPTPRRKILRYGGAFLILVVVGSMGAFATIKQYKRDHADNLRAIHIVDVTVRQEEANSVYVFQVSVENTTDQDIRGSMICLVAKPNFPLQPFGDFDGNTAKQREFEDYLFRRMDDFDKSSDSNDGITDLPAQKTVFGYCRSAWIPTEDEITRLHHGEFVLSVAGRIMIPSKIDGAHVDVEFCRIGDQNFGLQNCFSHNVPRVRILPRGSTD